MKHTKVMLAALGTFMVTWILITMLFSYLGDYPFRETMGNCFMFMVVLGWVPALIVGMDLSEKLSQ